MSKISSFKLEGLVSATFTPMKENGDVDYDKIEAYCNYLVENRIYQIYVNGTTGEGASLSLDERMKCAEKWMEVGRKTPGKLKAVVVQCGALNLEDSKALARHAASIGADAIATLPPLFFKPKSNKYLIDYCKALADEAPNTPFYFYHIPHLTGLEVNIEDLLREGVKVIPSLVGVKFSSKDLVDLIGFANLEAPHRDDKRFNVMYGCDEQLLAGIVTGAVAGVGSTYQFIPKQIHQLMKLISEGRIAEARQPQLKIQQVCRIMYGYGTLLGHNTASQKAFMSFVGIDLGPSRCPMRGPTKAETESLRKDLDGIGYFSWCK